MNMGFWQWVIVVIWALNLLFGIIMDGKPRLESDGSPERYHLINFIANVAISFIILYFGGFFK